MESWNTCFFIGHREAGEIVSPALIQAVERHITEYGVREFVVGHYGGFDNLAASVVREAKKSCPEVTLSLLLPYHPHDLSIPSLKEFDNTFYPPGMENVPKRAAIIRANRYMVEHSTHLIAYVWHAASQSKELLEYARKREKRGWIHIENLAPQVQ